MSSHLMFRYKCSRTTLDEMRTSMIRSLGRKLEALCLQILIFFSTLKSACTYIEAHMHDANHDSSKHAKHLDAHIKGLTLHGP